MQPRQVDEQQGTQSRTHLFGHCSELTRDRLALRLSRGGRSSRVQPIPGPEACPRCPQREGGDRAGVGSYQPTPKRLTLGFVKSGSWGTDYPACYQCDTFQNQPKAFLSDRAMASSSVPGLSHGRHRPRAAFPSFSPAPPYSKLQQALKKVNCWLDRSKDRYRQLKSINKHVRNLSLETHLHRENWS